MRRSSAPDPRPSALLRDRIERAARELNPYLVVVAIGLALVNLTGLALRIPHLSFTRGMPTAGCSPGQNAEGVASGSDAALRAGS